MSAKNPFFKRTAVIVVLAFFALFIGHHFWKRSFASKSQNEVEEIVSDSTSTPTVTMAKPGMQLQNAKKDEDDETSIDAFLHKENPQVPLKNWHVKMNSQGELLQITGGLFSAGRVGEAGAEALVRDLAEMFGVAPEDFKKSEKRKPSTVDVTGYSYQQFYEGYPVFQAEMHVFSRNSDGRLYSVVSEMKKIEDLDTRVDYHEPQAREAVLSEFSSNKNVVAENYSYGMSKDSTSEPTPWVYVQDSGRTELVWIYNVGFDRPFLDHRIVIVSAKTGQILKTESVLKY